MDYIKFYFRELLTAIKVYAMLTLYGVIWFIGMVLIYMFIG